MKVYGSNFGSNFLPTCAECSTAYPTPGVVAVRGDSVMAVCRECHRKMSGCPALSVPIEDVRPKLRDGLYITQKHPLTMLILGIGHDSEDADLILG